MGDLGSSSRRRQKAGQQSMRTFPAAMGAAVITAAVVGCGSTDSGRNAIPTTTGTTVTAVSASQRLAQLGIKLPDVPAPQADYVPAVRSDNLVFTSGQLPERGGHLIRSGKVGADVRPDDATALARICALNALAAIDQLVGIDKVLRVVKVVGFVASAPGFTNQPVVIDGASNFLVEVFGDAGGHARSAVGVAELPFNSPVEVEVVFEVK